MRRWRSSCQLPFHSCGGFSSYYIESIWIDKTNKCFQKNSILRSPTPTSCMQAPAEGRQYHSAKVYMKCRCRYNLFFPARTADPSVSVLVKDGQNERIEFKTELTYETERMLFGQGFRLKKKKKTWTATPLSVPH